jgi:AcrR family transcriptional regulator
MCIIMKARRSYVMRARAEAAEETRQGIIHAAISLYYEGSGPGSTLEQIAERAGVTVQTVLRHFGGRAALVEAAGAEALARVREERRAAPGDLAGAVSALFDHYERVGRSVLGLLAQETLTGAPDLSEGRVEHRRWVEEVLGPQLARTPKRGRAALVDQLAVVTDIFAWKLLRLDRGLGRRLAEHRVRDMLAALLAAHGEE